MRITEIRLNQELTESYQEILNHLVPEMSDDELYEYLLDGTKNDIDCMVTHYEKIDDFESCIRIKKFAKAYLEYRLTQINDGFSYIESEIKELEKELNNISAQRYFIRSAISADRLSFFDLSFKTKVLHYIKCANRINKNI
jgi:hypothetical protein